MEKVADLLARKHPQFNNVSTSCLVSDALYQMSCEKIDHLIVLEDDRFKGIITHYDIASKILQEDRPLNKIKVVEIMNHDLPVATPESTLQACMHQMERYNVRFLVIFDRFDFKGIISAYDLMQEALHSHSDFFSDEMKTKQGYRWNY